MSNLIIIQARYTSTRLPGKVLSPLWNRKNLLDLQQEKIRELNIPFVVATSNNGQDDLIVNWAKDNEVDFFRGDELNVLDRFIECAEHFDAKNIIRVCSDNPLLQLEYITEYLRFLDLGYDYVSHQNLEGLPAIKTHWGLFVEGVTLNALKKAKSLLEGHEEKDFFSEHVTNFLYGNPELFKIKLIDAPDHILTRNDLRFTIDTPEDFMNMSELLNELGEHSPSLFNLIETTDSNSLFIERMKKGIESFSK